jgi:hypothetical protein
MSARWWWLGAAFSSAGLMLVAVFGIFLAAIGGSFTGCEAKSLPVTVTGPAGPAPSAYALQSIPPERLALYEQAGRRFDIDWSFLASIGAQECGNGSCAGVNSSGCAGPMQIAYVRNSPCSPGSGPTLWERFAVSSHAGQAPDINDPGDAIYTAARILRDMGAPPTGGSYNQYREAACHYYGACGDPTVAYAAEIMARAVQYGFDGAGSPAPSSPPLAQPPSESEEPASACSGSYFSEGEAGSAGIVKLAKSQIGQSEHPEGSNCTKYGPCEEWCSLFVAWVWQHAGVALPGAPADYGYSGSLYTWVKEHDGRTLLATARPAPGDAVFYGTGPSDSAHVGIVAEVLTDEGNYENKVTRVGPFPPASPIGEKAAIYGYAQPPAAAPIEARSGATTTAHTQQQSAPTADRRTRQ